MTEPAEQAPVDYSSQRLPMKRWMLAAIFAASGVVASIVLWIVIKMMKGSSHKPLLVWMIVLGTLGAVLLGLGIYYAQQSLERAEFKGKWTPIRIRIGIHTTQILQTVLALVAVAAAILMGFGYPIP